HARDARDDAVGGTADEVAPYCGVLAVGSPPGDDVITLIELFEQARNVGRIVLQIRVERNDYIATRVIEPGHEGRCLSEVAAKIENAKLWAPFGDLVQDFTG